MQHTRLRFQTASSFSTFTILFLPCFPFPLLHCACVWAIVEIMRKQEQRSLSLQVDGWNSGLLYPVCSAPEAAWQWMGGRSSLAGRPKLTPTLSTEPGPPTNA